MPSIYSYVQIDFILFSTNRSYLFLVSIGTKFSHSFMEISTGSQARKPLLREYYKFYDVSFNIEYISALRPIEEFKHSIKYFYFGIYIIFRFTHLCQLTSRKYLGYNTELKIFQSKITEFFSFQVFLFIAKQNYHFTQNQQKSQAQSCFSRKPMIRLMNRTVRKVQKQIFWICYLS